MERLGRKGRAVKRRAFLGFLGAGVASGPSAVKTLADTQLHRVGVGAVVKSSISEGCEPSGANDGFSLAARIAEIKRRIADLKSGKDEDEGPFHIEFLAPSVASLTSVSLVHKVNMQAKIARENRRREKIGWLQSDLKALLDSLSRGGK